MSIAVGQFKDTSNCLWWDIYYTATPDEVFYRVPYDTEEEAQDYCRELSTVLGASFDVRPADSRGDRR